MFNKEIDEVICKIFYNDKKHYYEVLKAITELLNKNRKRNITDGSYKNLKFYVKTTVKLFMKKRYFLLKMFLTIRRMAKGIKEKAIKV